MPSSQGRPRERIPERKRSGQPIFVSSNQWTNLLLRSFLRDIEKWFEFWVKESFDATKRSACKSSFCWIKSEPFLTKTVSSCETSKLFFYQLIIWLFCGKKEAICEWMKPFWTSIFYLQITARDDFWRQKTAQDYKFLGEASRICQRRLQLDLYPNPDSLISELMTIHQVSTCGPLWKIRSKTESGL